MRKFFWPLFFLLIQVSSVQAFTVSAEEGVPETDSARIVNIRFMGKVNAASVNRLMQIVDNELAIGRVEEIDILISSTGGDTGSGIAAYNYLRALPGSIKVKTHNLSAIASAAILLFCAGKERSTSPIAQFTIHQGSNDMNGSMLTYDKFRETSEWMKSYNEMSEQIIAACTKRNIAEVTKRHLEGAVFNSREAKEWGLVHSIRDFVPNGSQKNWNITPEL